MISTAATPNIILDLFIVRCTDPCLVIDWALFHFVNTRKLLLKGRTVALVNTPLCAEHFSPR